MTRNNKPKNGNNQQNQPDRPVSNGLTPKQSLKKLDNKEKRFVQEYLIDLDVERSAIAAGYSISLAKSGAYQWISNYKVKPHVFDAIQKALRERSKRTEITQDRVLEEYAKLAFLNPKQFYTEEGDLIPIHELPDEVAAALTGIDVDEIYTGKGKDRKKIGQTTKIKFSDKKGSLDSVAKHLGMFIDRAEVSGPGGSPITFKVVYDE